MSNLKQKVSYRAMALFMAVLMLVSTIPATVIALAFEADEESPFKAKNFTAEYNAETDAIDMTWDAFETNPYELWVCVNDLKHEQIDVSATTYSISISDGNECTYSLLAYIDDEDSSGVESDKITTAGAFTLGSLPNLDGITVDNDLTITEIVNRLPTETTVFIKEVPDLTSDGHKIVWDTESTVYDQNLSTEQVITVPGTVVLDTKKVQNRDEFSLDSSVTVTLKE
ncbi:MAG: hypothetical protein K2H01_04565, partial [Ruminococcus sp.]|nr:hypothetical protein [Ruminococcus sp.]